ncbi:hypothetical protein GCK72_015252 [Caenorhabditis remanei]|uniref:Uncharacterized protein n=1 Tax=Caenorhabditis remanei TaxID=31234 RepID=A0A6A5GWR9_CAERE|nr:hypothetical protein GCK72_015252 [Caenorhabditis remanei]KAF1758792.1 hypothetical protein GCK72_015252 [Caenorhabditis remanei]
MKYDMSHHRKESDSSPSPAKSVKEMLAEFQNKLDGDDNRFRKPPPPSPRRAPPPPPHRKPSTQSSPLPRTEAEEEEETLKRPEEYPEDPPPTEINSNSLRRSLGPKPKVAPKPLFLNGLLPTSSSTPDVPSHRPEAPPHSSCTTPTILVSPATSDYSNGGFFDSNGNGNVKDRARQLVNMGFVPRVNNGGGQIERPISQVSTLSQVSDEFDDGDTSASDEESTVDSTSHQNLRRHRHEDDFDELPLPRNDRKTTAVATTHSEIMHEMEHLFVRGGNKKVNGNNNGNKPSTQQRRQSNIDEIPADVGKLRDNRKGRHNSLFVSPTSGISSTSTDDFSRITSMTSDRSSIVTSHSGGGDSADGTVSPIPDYETGNEEEDQRLKKLHYAAVEFLKVQSNYVQYLKEMAVLYPEYMERFGKRAGHDLLAHHNGQESVVLQIKKILVQILPIHEMLLKEVDTVVSNWDSRTPNMSKTIGTFADFLKCCQPFLDKKAEFMAKLLQMRNEDREFDEATYMFETEVFKRGKKGAVIQQLDQVHQNFMRYKLLMLRYSEYLTDGSDEKKKAEEAIAKLESVTQAVNQKMGLPTTDDLTKLYYRFQCQFNVLEPGRVLIRQGDVMKQTRKEEQPRYLVLFTDCLWICRVSSSRTLSSGGQFEMNRSYRIPLEYMRFERMEEDEYVKCLMVRSKVKSAVIIFPTEKERNQWADDLAKAQFDRKSYKRRQSTAVQKHDENKLKMKKLLMLAEKNNITESPHDDNEEEDVMRPNGICGNSRSTSGSQDELSSVPVTPLDIGDYDGGIFDVGGPQRNGSKKQAVADVIKPVWLPDNISNECLMEGCSTEFSIINRRHHCRDCGWLICKYCKGQAPLAKYEFLKQNVCSECYDRQFEIYKAGTLFPTKNIVIQSDGTHMVKIGKRNEQDTVDPRKLFKPPVNFGFKHRNVEEKRAGSIVFGRVYLRNRKSEVIRHALLRRDDLKLVFYKAELDSKSVFEVLIYGYFYREIQLEDSNGWLFELIHRNQIRTNDTKDDIISFRVDNNTSAKKWSAAFADKLELDPTFCPSS